MSKSILALAFAFSAACGGATTLPVEGAGSCAVRSDSIRNDVSTEKGANRTSDCIRQCAVNHVAQGSSESETRITASIRKGILSNDTLSFTAKNVTVITVGNRVTLRGPVKRGVEWSAIELIAKHTEGVDEVDNQLEVKN